MIQRIQTLYLLIIAVLSAVLIFTPAAGLTSGTDGSVYEIQLKGLTHISAESIEVVASTWALTAIAALVSLISFISIFLFKKRMLQMRLSFINVVLMAGYYGILFIYLWQYGKNLDAHMYLNMIASFNLINIILCILAIRAIGKDEALVKSLDRLR